MSYSGLDERNCFICITSEHVIVRTLAMLRSLDATGALENALCYVLCLDASAQTTLEQTKPANVTKLLVVDDLPEVAPFASRPISRFAVTCKPFLMHWALTKGGATKVLYFDSDMWFVQNPSFLFHYLDDYDVLLIPAVINPKANMQHWQTVAKNAQRTGYYNAGSLGCSDRANAFLEWWADRCAYSTFRDFYQDISGDQKYLNWVPSLFPNVKIVRHYGINIKPWIAQHASIVRQSDGSVKINGDPLVYFHFSQNLGNLEAWAQDLYPEVSKYLSELEKARIACGKSYVDMPKRTNKDLVRPLLPREGFEARWIKFYHRLRNSRDEVKRAVTSFVARSGRFMPLPLRKRQVKRYLRKWWQLKGDIDIDIFDSLYHSLTKKTKRSPFIFFGVTRFAYYLAYLGHQVVIYDPFQGYYNKELNSLFNPQFEEAKKMCDFLGIGSNLSIERVPFAEVRDTDKFRMCFIAARLGKKRIFEIAKKVAHWSTWPDITLLYNGDWSEKYREMCDTLTTTLSGWEVEVSSNDFTIIMRGY